MKMRGTGKRSAAPRQEEGGCETERERWKRAQVTMHMHRLIPKRYRDASTASNVYVASRGSSMCAAADSLPVCVLRRYGDRCVVTGVFVLAPTCAWVPLSADAPRQVSRRRIWRMLARPGFVPLARPAFYSFIFVVGAGRPQVALNNAQRGVAVPRGARAEPQRSVRNGRLTAAFGEPTYTPELY